MAGFLADRVYDTGLSSLDTEADILHLCSAQPATYAEALSLALGSKSSLSISAPVDRAGGGRKVTVAAIASGGNIAISGTATHYAIVHSAATRLLAANSLGALQAYTAGDTFTMPAFDIGIPDPA